MGSKSRAVLQEEQGIRITALRCALEHAHYTMEHGLYVSVEDLVENADTLLEWLAGKKDEKAETCTCAKCGQVFSSDKPDAAFYSDYAYCSQDCEAKAAEAYMTKDTRY